MVIAMTKLSHGDAINQSINQRCIKLWQLPPTTAWQFLVYDTPSQRRNSSELLGFPQVLLRNTTVLYGSPLQQLILIRCAFAYSLAVMEAVLVFNSMDGRSFGVIAQISRKKENGGEKEGQKVEQNGRQSTVAERRFRSTLANQRFSMTTNKQANRKPDNGLQFCCKCMLIFRLEGNIPIHFAKSRKYIDHFRENISIGLRFMLVGYPANEALMKNYPLKSPSS